jgi:hypothetical protein
MKSVPGAVVLTIIGSFEQKLGRYSPGTDFNLRHARLCDGNFFHLNLR